MTKLLEQAVAQLRELPEGFQDKAARQLIQYVDQISTDERLDIEEGQEAYRQGKFTSLAQWRNEMGLGDN
jgi:DNA topoisomerase IB